MKDFRKLSEATGRIYLVMFLVAFLCMLSNTAYICIDYSGIHVGESIERKLTESVQSEKAKNADQSYTLPEYGLDFSGSIYDKATEYVFFLAMAGIIFLLVLRELSVNDIRTREFEQTLPVKKTALVMHEYWFFFLLIVSMNLLQGIILSGFQKHYNNVWIRVSGVEAQKGFNSIPNEKMWIYLGFYIITLLLGFTWIFLCMTLCRNSLLGIIVSIGTWTGSYYIWYNDGFDFLINLFVGREPAYNDASFYVWCEKEQFLRSLTESILNPFERFRFVDQMFHPNQSWFGLNTFNMTPMVYMAMLCVILMIGILLIWVAAKKRQLSNGGQYSYFITAEYLFALLCGGLWFTCYTESLYIFDGMGDFTYCLLAILSTLAVTALVVFLIRRNAFIKEKNFYAKQGFAAKCFSKKQSEKKSNSHRERQIVKLLYSESVRFVLFLIIGIIAVYVLVEKETFYHDFYSHGGNWAYYLQECFDISHWSNVFYSDYVSNTDLGFIQFKIICTVMVVLLLSKLSRYWMERKAGTREFLSTIPVKRGVKFSFSVVRDLLITLIPVLFISVCMDAQTQYIATIYKDLDAEWVSQTIMRVNITDIGYVFMLVGLLHFIEEMFKDGIMKLFGFLSFVMMTAYSLISMRTIYYKVPVFRSVYGMFTPDLFDVESNSYSGCAILYFAIGLVFFVFAYCCSKKKDDSRDGLYFAFQKYLIAAVLSIAVFCMAQPYILAQWHRVFVAIASILLFVILIYFMTPRETKEKFAF